MRGLLWHGHRDQSGEIGVRPAERAAKQKPAAHHDAAHFAFAGQQNADAVRERKHRARFHGQSGRGEIEHRFLDVLIGRQRQFDEGDSRLVGGVFEAGKAPADAHARRRLQTDALTGRKHWIGGGAGDGQRSQAGEQTGEQTMDHQNQFRGAGAAPRLPRRGCWLPQWHFR